MPLARFSHSYELSVDFDGGSGLQLARDHFGYSPSLKIATIVYMTTLWEPFFGKNGHTAAAVIVKQPAS